MREIRTSGLMSGEGKRDCANGSRTAPLLDSTDQGQEAAHSRRYIRPHAPRHRSSGRHSRSRWWNSRHGDPIRDVSIFENALCRRRYQGPQFAKAVAKVLPHLNVEIVKRSDRVGGFVVLPQRWIVERTIAWLNRCRRLAKDWESLNRKALAFLRLASIRLMLRKLCNQP